MGSFPRRFYLRRDEKVLVEEGITPAWGLEQAIVWLIVGLVLFGGLSVPVYLSPELEDQQNILFLIGVGFVTFWFLMLIYAWRRIATSEFVVSEEAVYTRRGKLLLAVDVATLDRVTDLHVHTGIVGRLFGYSRLVVKTAGGELLMLGMRDAYHVRGVVHDARQRLLTRLLREAGRDETASPRPGGALQIECPNCNKVLSIRGKPPVDVLCPHCQATGTLFAEALA